MLARLAENLFWAGRYTERAEDTTRMLDVTYHTQLESTSGEVVEAWRQLLEVLHLADAYHGPLQAQAVMRFLMLDPD
ncbi:MAG: alpha-E domain-containing protein, partial [Nitriliruptoraceae bacterium]